MFLLLKFSDQQFHSPASYTIYITGIHLHTLVVFRLGKLWQAQLCGRQEKPFVNRVCIKFEYVISNKTGDYNYVESSILDFGFKNRAKISII